MLLEGRRAIVTGGATGIGKATCERLGREGAAVCVNYYADGEADGAKALAEQIGHGSIALQADVGREDDVKRLVETAAGELGGVDLRNRGEISNDVMHRLEREFDLERERLEI